MKNKLLSILGGSFGLRWQYNLGFQEGSAYFNSGKTSGTAQKKRRKLARKTRGKK